MRNLFDKNYYEHGEELGISGYSYYRWMPELTIPMCARLCEVLGITLENKILDFGCAKGFLVKAFRLLHRETYGVDISSYAINNAPPEVRKYVKHINCPEDLNGTYDWIIAKDVLEHISYDMLDEWLTNLRRVGNKMCCIIPLGNSKKYVIPDYENDTSHVIRESLQWWQDKFVENNFNVIKATYRMRYIKENWIKWEKGNGFFILNIIKE